MEATIDLFGDIFDIEIKKLTSKMNDGIALYAIERGTGEFFGTITINNPKIPLQDGEICVKTYSENSWVPQLLTLFPNDFKDTGKRVEVGFMTVPIWWFME